MIPLTLIPNGETNLIKKVGGSTVVRQHLENHGFVAGADVTVISSTGGNAIVSIKGSRVAVSKEMAQKIMV